MDSVRRSQWMAALRRVCAAGLVVTVSSAPLLHAAGAEALEQSFQSAPPDNRPICFWGWVAGHVTKEGIRADLQAMKDAGMRGAILFDVSLYMPQGPVMYGTPEWRDCVDFAIQTAAEMGLVISLQNCPGWATSGGPWVSVNQSMKQLSTAELPVSGPGLQKLTLPKPPSRLDFYREVAVLAVPSASPPPTPSAFESNVPGADLARLQDGAGNTSLKIPAGLAAPEFTFTFAEPATIRTLELLLAGMASGPYEGEIFSSADGVAFSPVRKFNLAAEFKASNTLTVSFPPITAKAFRVVLNAREGSAVAGLAVAELRFSNVYRLDGFQALSLSPVIVTRNYTPPAFPLRDDPDAIRVDQVIDLTDKLQPDGTLEWDVPPGRWDILRIGYTTTGAKNHPAQPAGEGLETDKMDAEVTRSHFRQSLGEILDRAANRTPRGLDGVLIDSWEAGRQNWTQRFPEEFAKRRGYDMKPFLPVLMGRVVQSAADATAFLADFRRTICDLIAENYFGAMRREANARGLKLYAEPYPGFTFDEYAAASNVDVVVAEFWLGMDARVVKRMSSLVETQGGTEVAAEAFTARPSDGRWQATPGSIKPVADRAFVNGLNRCVLHAWALQPRNDLRPGFTYGRYGTDFGRLNTWWPLAGPFVDYLSRTGMLLQHGARVADFLFLKNSGPFTEDGFPPVPAGYDGNAIAPFTLLRSQLKDGRVVPPAGGSYAAVVLPSSWFAETALLEKLAELHAGGVAVLGPPPVMPDGRLGLMDLEKWNALVAKLWPSGRQPGPASSHLAKAAEERGLAPDVRTIPAKAPIEWAHRSKEGLEFYFVRNTSDTAQSVTLDLRVSGRRPEIWDPVTAARSDAAAFSVANGRTQIALSLPPSGSLFIVFRQALPARWLSQITGPDGRPVAAERFEDGLLLPAAGQYALTFSDGSRADAAAPAVPGNLPVTGPWKVRFEPAYGKSFDTTLSALTLWNENSDPRIRHFSGPAVYAAEFTAPDTAALPHRAILDLGEVYDLAEVVVNGRKAAVLWTAPYQIDVTPYVKPGRNTLAIRVVNRWINRLIGDEALPPDAKYDEGGKDFTLGALLEFPEWYYDKQKLDARSRATFSTWKHYTAQSPLVKSGLGGPVTLRFLPIIPLAIDH